MKNTRYINLKWIKNRNLTPLYDIKVKENGLEKTIGNYFDEYLNGTRSNLDVMVEIADTDWQMIQTRTGDLVDLRHLDFGKTKLAKTNDLFIIQTIIEQGDPGNVHVENWVRLNPNSNRSGVGEDTFVAGLCVNGRSRHDRVDTNYSFHRNNLAHRKEVICKFRLLRDSCCPVGNHPNHNWNARQGGRYYTEDGWIKPSMAQLKVNQTLGSSLNLESLVWIWSRSSTISNESRTTN